MKVIKPQIQPTLLYTNVAADSNAEWSDATTYALGNVVKVTSVYPHKVYRSLRGNNLERFPPDHTSPVAETSESTTSITVGTGAKTFTTDTGKTYSAGQSLKISKTTTPEQVNMDCEVTSYSKVTGSLVVNVTAVVGSGTHNVWTILGTDEIGFWAEVGSTNQYAMLDTYANTQTTNTDSISVKLGTNRVDHVALFGLYGHTVNLELWNSGETTKYWETEISLVYGDSTIIDISDWYEYFFGDYNFKEDITQQLGAITYEGVLVITITANSGEQAKCGMVVIGRGLELGCTQFGVSAGINDYSVKETDDLGRSTLSQGYWSKTNSLTIKVDNAKVDSVYKNLVALRGIPTAWVGTNTTGDQYEAFTVYGIFKDFTVVVEGTLEAYCELSIEGLI